MRAKIV